ncbi:MAG: ABC transporter ATP-binding protein [Chloroflexi bacterium]|nr:ABC transporter ATP-binding protein [Chloroflexota bacterium]
MTAPLRLPERHPAVALAGVARTYASGADVVRALEGVDLRVARGEAVAITGPSGSGKTTLLNLVAGLDRPTAGTITVFGTRIEDASERELAEFRAHHVGLVFQDPHLLSGLTALENLVAARLPWGRWRDLQDEARALLTELGLADRLDAPPSRLSGGERQRVGLARALMGSPELLLADEPTGNLDAATTEGLIGMLEAVRHEHDLTIVLATHDPAVAAFADRVVHLVGGRVDGERRLDRAGPLEARALEDR